MKRTKEEADGLAKELRYTQQVVASELAGWQEVHERMGRKAVRDLARGMLIKERTALEGMQRAIRKLRVVPVVHFSPGPSVVEEIGGEEGSNGGQVVGGNEGVVEETPAVEES